MWVLILLPIHIPCFWSRGSQLGAILYPHPGIFGDVYRPFLLSQLGWMEGEALLVYSRLRPGVLLSLLHGQDITPTPLQQRRMILPEVSTPLRPRNSALGSYSHWLYLRGVFPLYAGPFPLPRGFTLFSVLFIDSLTRVF